MNQTISAPTSPTSPLASPSLDGPDTSVQVLGRPSVAALPVLTPMSSWSSNTASSMRSRSTSIVSLRFPPDATGGPDRLLPGQAHDDGGPTVPMTSVSPGRADGRQSRMDERSPARPLWVKQQPQDDVLNRVDPLEGSPKHHKQSSNTSGREWPVSPRRSAETSLSQSSSRVRSRSPIHNHHRSSPLRPEDHVTVLPSNSTYANAIAHLRTPLVPLVSASTDLPHPCFPQSLLQYHLLTHEQLDSLARWYHQVEPAVEETGWYPTRIQPWTSLDNQSQTRSQEQVGLETKRRRWGRFIGLGGCESPTASEPSTSTGRTEERDLVEKMEREWRNAMYKADEEEQLREKGWRGRW